MPYRRGFAEAVGTFVLVFGGVGSAVVAGEAIGALGVALAFGLSLLAMAYAIGPISGCHINPAVTLGMLLSGRIARRDAVEYWVAQVAGAILAALALFVVIKSREGGYDLSENGFGANGYGDHSPGGFGLGGALIAEVLLTTILVFTVLAASDRIAEAAFAGIPIGLVLTLIHLVGIPITNTSVNPARSLGPALFVGGWALGQLWLFVLAPLLGGVLGFLLHRTLYVRGERLPAGRSAGEPKEG